MQQPCGLGETAGDAEHAQGAELPGVEGLGIRESWLHLVHEPDEKQAACRTGRRILVCSGANKDKRRISPKNYYPCFPPTNSSASTRPAFGIENRAPGFETKISIEAFRDSGLKNFAFGRPDALNDHADRHAFGRVARNHQWS